MPRKRRNQVTDEEIRAAYLAHKSGTKVAELLGIGTTTISRVLRKMGVPMTGLTEYRKTISVREHKSKYRGSSANIIAWYAAGESLKTIAKRIGRSTRVVQRIVNKAGITRSWQAGGPEHSMWTGGRNYAGGGYWRVWLASDDPMASMRTHNGYVREHRLVLARKLGRPLLRTETVHHIDGNKANNAPENLELRQGQHGKHVVMACLDCGSRRIGPVKLEDQCH